jgi:hypothetical protein
MFGSALVIYPIKNEVSTGDDVFCSQSCAIEAICKFMNEVRAHRGQQQP